MEQQEPTTENEQKTTSRGWQGDRRSLGTDLRIADEPPYVAIAYISKILSHRLGTHIEYYWDGEQASRETVLNDGDIKLTGDAYMSCRRVYTNKHLTAMETVWTYRPHGDYTDSVDVAKKLAHQMIMESERNLRR